jgi:hypothetical protein
MQVLWHSLQPQRILQCVSHGSSTQILGLLSNNNEDIYKFYLKKIIFT